MGVRGSDDRLERLQPPAPQLPPEPHDPATPPSEVQGDGARVERMRGLVRWLTSGGPRPLTAEEQLTYADDLMHLLAAHPTQPKGARADGGARFRRSASGMK
jgi:hypothetical protein